MTNEVIIITHREFLVSVCHLLLIKNMYVNNNKRVKGINFNKNKRQENKKFLNNWDWSDILYKYQVEFIVK